MGNEESPAIEVRVDHISQLFNTLDPFPFAERDLDKDAEEYIVSWARELPRDQPLRIRIHVPVSEVSSDAEQIIVSALNRFFEYRAGLVVRELREMFRIGRTSLLIGIVVLALCLAAARLARTTFGDAAFGSVLQESLIILGWVANWKPIEILLYDWWPLLRRRNMFRRLAEADVELKPYVAKTLPFK